MSNTNKPLTAEFVQQAKKIVFERHQGSFPSIFLTALTAMRWGANYNSQQTAALRDQLEKVTQLLSQERELHDDVVNGLKYSLDSEKEELEAVKKERDWLDEQFRFLRNSYSRVVPERNEAVKLLDKCLTFMNNTTGRNTILVKMVRDFLRLSSGETKPDTFELWLKKVTELLLSIGYKEPLTLSAESWRPLFDQGLIPWKAVREMEFDGKLEWRKLRDMQPASPWISVEERLPEKNCTDGACVLGMSGKVPMIVTYTSGREIDVMDEFDELDETQVDTDEKTGMVWLKPGWYELEEQSGGAYDNAWIKREVTHWMPLPAPPECLNDKTK